MSTRRDYLWSNNGDSVTETEPAIVELEKTFRFEAAHHLPNVEADHRCARVHGHSYTITIRVTGPVDPDKGWLMDFNHIGDSVGPWIEQLDHRSLNDIEGLENPTTEVLAVWLWDRVVRQLPQLDAIIVAETERTRCVYRGARRPSPKGEKV